MQQQDIQILVLGHSDEDIRIFRQALEPIDAPLSFRQIRNLKELADTLSADRQQIVVANEQLEGCDVLTLVKACREVSDDVPVIVVSDHSNEKMGIALFQAGVQDYVNKNRLYRMPWGIQRETIRLRQKQQFLEEERQIRRVEKRLAGLLDMSPDAVIAIDIDHRIIVFNTGAERIFGYSAEEIIGRPLEALMPARFAGGHQKYVSAFSRSPVEGKEMGSRGTLVGLRKDGTEFPAEASISILKEDTGPIFFAVLRDITEKMRAAQEMQYLATHDSLTGLPNRALFMDRLSHVLALAEREERLAALLFIDLDGFKRVNDNLGHAAGDELLRAIAKRLQEAVRRSDTVARLGGDEFAVILERIRHVDAISAITQNLIDRVREPVRLANGEVSVSASIGITLCPVDARTVKELMIDADRAMYVAKTAGKNRFEFYSAELANTDSHGIFSPSLHSISGPCSRLQPQPTVTL